MPQIAEFVGQVQQVEKALQDLTLPQDKKLEQLKGLLQEFLVEEFVGGIQESLSGEVRRIEGDLKSPLLTPVQREQLQQRRFHLQLQVLGGEFVQKQRREPDNCKEGLRIIASAVGGRSLVRLGHLRIPHAPPPGCRS